MAALDSRTPYPTHKRTHENRAADRCQGLGEDELELFRDVLRPEVSVTREEFMKIGARRCAHRIEVADDD
ncbi:MAG: hypothetical protein QF515_13435 [Pseudomonadales bacterium]|jgi:hypothetical protein|nr:hypothetical protein [Pseudomonadales bacterium]MDP6828093.1 hypothetical protein [Pseudomonadales bacterium]|tara:strand:- start:1368 stop:1577 length:210 start_codon:yes stop_codon:yes gene_type:complete